MSATPCRLRPDYPEETFWSSASGIVDKDADKIVREIGIPPCPAILTKLLKEMREDEPDYNKASKLIGADVSLAAAMLKTVNSAFFGLATKATSVNQALHWKQWGSAIVYW